MTRVLIGIHVYEDPERLKATLASLREHTPAHAQVVLLPDGPDAPTRAALAALPHVRQFPSERPRGTAAAFNRLAGAGDADIVVLLESGCLVTPGWLDALLRALELKPYGLAGPSTNTCWNEQGALPSAVDAERAATSALAMFGNELHRSSLCTVSPTSVTRSGER